MLETTKRTEWRHAMVHKHIWLHYGCYLSWFKILVRYGRAELWYVVVLAEISLYFLACFAFLGRLTMGVNMSMCLELVAVRWANLSQSFLRRKASRSSPKSSSWRVCDGSQRPVMAAIATL